MMDSIIQIKGAVNFNITLDPTIWIFDDRKVDLDTYFTSDKVAVDQDEVYLEDAGKFWSREIMEGAAYPPTLETEKKFDRQKMQTGTFGMVLEPFINNASPTPEATQVTFIDRENNEYTYSMEEAKTLLFQFSVEGKMLTDGGPVYLLHADGSNYKNPIKNIVGIKIS